MSEQRDLEEQAASLAWGQCLEQGEGSAVKGFEGDAPCGAIDESLVREYTELLGLLPQALEPAVPNLSTKVRLLAVVGGDAAASGTMRRREAQRPPSAMAAAAAARTVEELTFQAAKGDPAWPQGGVAEDRATLLDRSAVDVTLHHGVAGDPSDHPSASVTVLPSREEPDRDDMSFGQGYGAEVDSKRPAASGTPWLSWAMAAMLGFCMLGLGYLAGESRQQEATIAHLQADLLEQQVKVEEPGLERLLDELSTAQRRLRMVTEVARTAYPLRTVSTATDAQSRPDGIMYVCGQHQRWYLNVKGLEPPSPGKEYHLWFMTADGTVDGGILDVEPGVLAIKEANSMPVGTRGFSVTLEEAGVGGEPEGLMVLLGEQAVSL